MKKTDLVELEIVDNGMNFEGIARLDDKVVFVPYGIKGEKVIASIVKDTKSYLLANIEKIKVKSKYRVDDDCGMYEKCGGCAARHMTYDKTLEIKKDIVKNTLRKQGISDKFIENIYGMGIPYNYRNKVQYPVRSVNSKNVMGMFSERSHDLIEVNDCSIQDKELNEVAKDMFECICEENISCYNEKTKEGNIKNIMVRKGINTGELLCIFVSTDENVLTSEKGSRIVEKLIKKHNNIKGIVVNVNDTKGNVILGNKNIVIYGEDRVKDIIGDFTYNISTNSFFQVNTIMAEVLFNILKEKMNLKKEETLLELYSGVGTIGIFLSGEVSKVYGAEIVEDAVKMAKENLKLNNISNVEYIVGDASTELVKLQKQNVIFDNVIVDPPRKGLDDEGIDTILKLQPKKIAYVSCNPSTLSRDLKKLTEKYEIESINLFDLFPWTKHCESITILERK